MTVILIKLLIIKSVSEIQCLIRWFFLLFYVGSSRLRAAVCWNSGREERATEEKSSRLRAAVCWNAVDWYNNEHVHSAAASARLCVETSECSQLVAFIFCSRLRAAVCWNIQFFGFLVMAGAAAFGRLCVETLLNPVSHRFELAAAFGRLCVETLYWIFDRSCLFAAAFGRLCVETLRFPMIELVQLAAAFGRLCVETWRKENFSHLNRLRL